MPCARRIAGRKTKHKLSLALGHKQVVALLPAEFPRQEERDLQEALLRSLTDQVHVAARGRVFDVRSCDGFLA